MKLINVTGMRLGLCAMVCLLALPFATNAHAVVLDFDSTEACPAGCSTGTPLDPAYGDTAVVDVETWRVIDLTGEIAPLQYAHQFYSDLIGSAISLNSPSGHVGLLFQPGVTGYELTLNSFDLGVSWPQTIDSVGYEIFDGSLIGLFESGVDVDSSLATASGSVAVDWSVRTTITPNISSANGFIIRFESAFIGIDNIEYTLSGNGGPPEPPVNGVPEPGTLTLLGAGLMGLTMSARRRRKV